MFREDIDGFKDGLGTENYINITKASRATATRDLHEPVEIGALTKTGGTAIRAITSMLIMTLILAGHAHDQAAIHPKGH
ncbi:MAG: hypothetical protein PHQ14_11715 [Chromatiales bacterium]|jgi:hypothetical protein|nr:hypothetical protein [Chromatiales bacterium]